MMNVSIRINRPKVADELIDGEVLVINLDTGDYFSLVKVGAEVWQGITQNLSKHNLVEQIGQRYDVQQETIEKSIDAFLEELADEELIVLEQIDVNGKNTASSQKISDIGEIHQKRKFEPPTLEKYTDMADLLLMDPIHDVDENGWPNRKSDI